MKPLDSNGCGGSGPVIGPEEVDPAVPPRYKAREERAIVIAVSAFDWNCPQHITPRFTEAEIEAAVAPLKADLAALRARLTDQEGRRP